MRGVKEPPFPCRAVPSQMTAQTDGVDYPLVCLDRIFAESVSLGFPRIQNVDDLHAPADQKVAQKPAVASPEELLRAHDAGPPLFRARHKLGCGGPESLCFHVVRVVSESGRDEGGVVGVFTGRSFAETAQVLVPRIFHPDGCQVLLEPFLPELGELPGARKTPDVRERFNPVLF